MAYVQLDDQIAQHPKVLRAGAEAAWLWACAIAYCNRQLTDGHIPAAALGTFGTFKTPVRKLAAVLIEVGLFDQVGPDYLVHDYLRHNPDRATVHTRMKAATDRKATYRARRSQRDNAITGRAGDAGVPVGHQRDTGGTGASSRATRTDSTPTPTPCVSSRDVEEPEPRAAVVPFDRDWGALPTQRRQKHCAWEATRRGLSVPQFLHEELLSKMATPDEAALLRWYASTEAAFTGRDIGEDALAFWRSRFREWRGTTSQPVAAAPMQTREEAAAELRRIEADRVAAAAERAERGTVRMRDLVTATAGDHA